MATDSNIRAEIGPVLSGLLPDYMTENLDDPDWVDESLPFDIEEYERVSAWWFESGAFTRVWNWLREDLGRFYPPILSTDPDAMVIGETDWVEFLDLIMTFGDPEDCDELLERVGEAYHPPDPDEWVEGLRQWVEADRLSALETYVHQETAGIRPTIRLKDTSAG